MSNVPNAEEISPEELRAALRTWRPEPEWEAAAPRPIPPEILNGPYRRARRLTVQLLFAWSVLTLVGGRAAAATEWGKFFPLFKYCDWIALGAAAIGCGYALRNRMVLGDLRLIRDGIPEPLIFLDADVVRCEDNNGMTYRLAFRCLRQGENDLPEEVFRFSRLLSPNERRFVEPTYRPGEVVTAVRLPGEAPDAARLYGLTELKDGVGFRIGARAAGAEFYWSSVGILILFAGFLMVAFQPRSQSVWTFALAPLGAGLATHLLTRSRFSAAALTPVFPGKSFTPLKDTLGADLLAFLGWTLLWIGPMLGINRWCDYAPTEKRTATLTGMDGWEFYGIYYINLDFRPDGAPEDEAICCRVPFDEDRKILSDRAELEIAPGLFGLSWVQSIRWLPPAPAPENDDPDAPALEAAAPAAEPIHET